MRRDRQPVRAPHLVDCRFVGRLKAVLTGRSQERLHVFDVDPALVDGLEPDHAATARELGVASTIQIEVGRWEPSGPRPAPAGFLGFLILEGLLERDVELGGIGCTDLLGPGDLINPWAAEEGTPSFPFEMHLNALETTRLAVLDARFAAAVARWPVIAAHLLERAARLTHSVGVHFAITCFVGLERRLWLLFWHLADRFGHVDRDGAVVPVPLTHEALARLVRARRPSVTTALGKLTETGLIERRADGTWLLRGQPSSPLLQPFLGGEQALDARKRP
jgi:CRP/FNR family cyclic AMP-dependent transcriptional regulator